MMKHAYGPYFDFVRKTGVEPRCPDEPRAGCCGIGRVFCVRGRKRMRKLCHVVTITLSGSGTVEGVRRPGWDVIFTAGTCPQPRGITLAASRLY